jgi:hypothetical protein
MLRFTKCGRRKTIMLKPFLSVLRKLVSEILVRFRKRGLALSQLFGWGLLFLVVIYFTRFAYLATPVALFVGLLYIASAIQERTAVERDKVKVTEDLVKVKQDKLRLLKSQITPVASSFTEHKAQKYLLNEESPLVRTINALGWSVEGGWNDKIPFFEGNVILEFKMVKLDAPGQFRRTLWKVSFSKIPEPDLYPKNLVLWLEPIQGSPYGEQVDTGEPLVARFDPYWAAYVEDPVPTKLYRVRLLVLVPKEELLPVVKPKKLSVVEC